MKKLLVMLLFIACMFPQKVRAQETGGFQLRSNERPRVTVGVGGGSLYSNTTISVVSGVEIPIHRFEIDARNEFSPYENHTGLGTGTAELLRGTGILWARSVGLAGNYEYNEYTTSIHKGMRKVFAGVILRKSLDGVPSRFEFDYVRQVQNHLVGGTESAYLQGGRFAMTTRMGCTGSVCSRLAWEMQGGRVFLQGNPICDGTFSGPVTCARQSAISGGVKASFVIEFPRNRGHEDDAF